MKILFALLAVSMVASCASYDGSGLRPGIDDGARVRATMGAPAIEFRDEAGRATWAYPHGPYGFHTFMVHFDAGGRIASIESVLDPPHFARVTPGISMEQVSHLIGPPGRTEAFPSRAELVWDFRFMDAWGYPSVFSVVFDRERRVRHTVTWRESYYDDH